MKLILTAILFSLLSSSAIAVEEEPIMSHGAPEISSRTKSRTRRFETEIRGGWLPRRTNDALDAIIRLAVYKLKRVNLSKEADRLLKEWEEQWQYFLINDGRPIGDHAPLSKWLAEKYDMLEFLLGKDVCRALRLDDLKVINYGLPVVISCVDNVKEEEYFFHFVSDPNYGPALGPTVGYWVSFFSCVGFTWGSGFLFCSPIAMGVEYLSEHFMCPKLNPMLWKWSCKQGDPYAQLASGTFSQYCD